MDRKKIPALLLLAALGIVGGLLKSPFLDGHPIAHQILEMVLILIGGTGITATKPLAGGAGVATQTVTVEAPASATVQASVVEKK